MRKSAFIRRYRTALSTTDPSEVNIKPIRLFENTNPRFAVASLKGLILFTFFVFVGSFLLTRVVRVFRILIQLIDDLTI